VEINYKLEDNALPGKPITCLQHRCLLTRDIVNWDEPSLSSSYYTRVCTLPTTQSYNPSSHSALSNSAKRLKFGSGLIGKNGILLETHTLSTPHHMRVCTQPMEPCCASRLRKEIETPRYLMRINISPLHLVGYDSRDT
jgi:hypothetical protein